MFLVAVSSPGGGRASPASRQAHRVIFIDLARAIAVVLMVLGHTSSALLAASYRSGPWFEAWVFQRGLTSGLFLMLAGFAFSIATTRHWSVHLAPSRAVFRRVRRFLLFIVLGYALHFPVDHFSLLPEATETQWRALLAVDVLQLIGAGLLALQALVMLARTRQRFMGASFALAAAVIAASPAVWAIDWTTRVPLWVAGYLSPGTGALFPLFPWIAFVLIGAGVGQVYAGWGASHLAMFANGAMLLPGAALVGLGVAAMDGLAGEVVVRTGACLIVIGLLAHLSRRIAQLPRVFGAVAQESLTVYFVHLCVVYGSIWNAGLVRVYGDALPLVPTILMALGVAAAMILLAWQWHGLKHGRPRTARWVAATAGIVLAARLL